MQLMRDLILLELNDNFFALDLAKLNVISLGLSDV